MEEERKDVTEMKMRYDEAPQVPQPYPWLVAIHGKQNQKQSFYSVYERRYHVRTIPELRNHSIRACCEGWLVLVSNNDLDSQECFLFNLITKERVQLPPMDTTRVDPSYCVVLSPPSNPDSRVVFLNDEQGTHVTVYYCKPGDTEFASHTFPINEKLDSPLAFKGKIYCLTKFQSNLLVLDLNNQKPELSTLLHKPLDKDQPGGVHFFESWLVASCQGELFFVYKMSFGVCAREAFGFQIFKFLDASEGGPSWMEVKSVGKNQVLFLDENWGIMRSISTTEESQNVKGNHIYFTQELDRCLYVFDWENQSISFSLPFHIARDPHYNWIDIPISNVD